MKDQPMSLTADKLYELLPAIHRLRDAKQGEPLKALLAVIAEQARVMERDIERLHDNEFIETCDEWVVPYIGDLLGVRGLHRLETGLAFSRRAHVANTLGYRRRKGTATMLEQLARDTTAWTARVVEFFELLRTTQYLNHLRPHNLRTPDLRRTNELEWIDTAFDQAAHTADVRRIAVGRGRHNIPNLGIFLWRLQSYTVARSHARPVATPSDGRYTFSPLGNSAPLFNRPQTEPTITHLAREINVPGPLRRRPLYDELEDRRQALVDGRIPVPLQFGSQPVLQVFVRMKAGDDLLEIPADEIALCNLSDPPAPIPEGWRRPPKKKPYQPEVGGPEIERTLTVGVDPVLGRLAFPKGVKPKEVKVGFSYGFSGDAGGGPYNRRDSIAPALDRPVTWQVGVSRDHEPEPGRIFATLAEAVTEWNAQPDGAMGIIAVMDSSSFEESLTAGSQIKVPEGSRLLIVAADWPELPVPGGLPGETQRVIGRIDPAGLRPHLLGDLSVAGTASASSETPGELWIDGLLIEGKVSVLSGNLGRLQLNHCTLVPGQGGLHVTMKNELLDIALRRTICGPIALPEPVHSLALEDCVVDAPGAMAVDCAEVPVALESCTVLGEVSALTLHASNSIFAEPVVVERLQTGCVRFCYVPAGSTTPRRFRCQPDLAIEAAKTAAEEDLIRARLVPGFTSTKHGDPGYAQLSRIAPVEIRTGAEDGAEMGVFRFLQQPQRETNLRTSLDEYLRLGMEAGLIFVT